MEIERKYLVTKVPENLEQYEKKVIEQGYICTHPTLRIRKSNENYILTYKSNKSNELGSTAICNEEIERLLPKEAYLHLREKVDGNIVRKTRYIIPLEKKLEAGSCEVVNEGLRAELDVFEGVLEGLVFVEVEFPDVAQADNFVKPDWFGEEVSADKRYRNTYLSTLAALSDF